MNAKLLLTLIIVFCLSFSLANALVYSNETVGYWNFEENGGTTALDFSPNLNNGTDNAAYVASKGTNGTGDYSLEFDGSTDYVIMQDSATNYYNFGDGSDDNPFSVGAWVYMHSSSPFRIASYKDGNNYEWFLTVDGSSFLRGQVHDQSAAATLQVVSDSTLTSYENTWTHIVFTYDGGSVDTGLELYINGENIAATESEIGTYVAMEDVNSIFEVGSINNGSDVGGSHADGFIDEPFVFDFELSQLQVEDIYENGIQEVDLTQPEVNSFTINDTNLTCDNTIRFEANVTDNIGILSVYFNFTDTSPRNEQATQGTGDIYFYEKNYTAGTTGTEIYNITLVIATDTSSNVNNYAVSAQYNYTCTMDVIDPIITSQLGAIIDITMQDEFNYSTGCYDENPHNFTFRIHNETDDILLRQNNTLSTDTNVSITGSLILSGISLGEYTINHTCFDDSSNTVNDIRTLIITDEVVGAITLIAPPNNSIDADGIVDYSFSIVTSATANLVINDIIIDTISASAGLNTFPQIQYFTNQSIIWKVNATKGSGSAESGSFFLDVNISSPPVVISDSFSLQECSTDSIPKVLMFMFFVGLSFAMMVLGRALKSGLIGTVGAIMLLILSAYFYACLFFVGLVMTAFALIMISYFIFRGAVAFS